MNNKQAQAHNFFQAGHFEQALNLYQQLLDHDPDSVELLHALAMTQIQLHHYDQAQKLLKKAQKLAPFDLGLQNTAGNLWMRQQAFDQAIDCFKNMIQQNKDYAPAYHNLGFALYQKAQFISAEKAFLKALALNPSAMDTLYNLALVYCQLKKNDQAIIFLEKVLEQNPKHLKACSQLGEIYLALEDFVKAADFFKKRLKETPNHTNSLHSLAQAEFSLGNFSLAIEAFEKVLILKGEYPQIDQELAHAYLHAGNPEKALHYYYRQLEVQALPETYYNIGVLLMDQSRFNEAIPYLQESLQQDPHHLPSYLNLGALYLKKQAYPLAISFYQKAAELSPNNAEILHILEAIEQKDGSKKSPESYLKNLFDHYASHYDQHLTQFLEYQLPEKLAQWIEAHTHFKQCPGKILDLGCGTGLAGVALKPYASILVGVDLSANMLKMALQKNIYTQLIENNLENILQETGDYNLIVAADVFNYYGELESVFSAVYTALKKPGWFLFSVEKGTEKPYHLTQNIRYTHQRAYIESVLEAHQFTLERLDQIILRKNQQQAIEGYLVLAYKS